MKKILILIGTIICMNMAIALEELFPLQELSSSLAGLNNAREIIKQKKQAAWTKKKGQLDAKFYADLKKALSKEDLKEILASLESITQKPGQEQRASIAIDIVTKLMKESEKISPDTYLFKYENLELKDSLFILTNYIIFITKIVEAIATEISKKPTDKIDIFTDEIFNNPLILYFLLSSLLNRDYQSIHIHILSPHDKTFTDLDTLLEHKKNNYSISKYKSINQFLDSGNKIDVYLTESILSGSNAQRLQCTNKRAPRKKGDFRLILSEYSNIARTNYILASKDIDQEIVKQIAEQSRDPKELRSTANTFECKVLKYSLINLADIIYRTNKSNNHKVLIFEFRYHKGNPVILPGQDTVREKETLTIIESLLNFTEYDDLYEALARNYLTLRSTNMDKVALFKVDPEDNKIISTNTHLNESESTLTKIIHKENKRTKAI